MGNTIQKIAFPVPNPPCPFKTKPHYLKNKKGDRIPVLYFPYKQADKKSERLIIFSHGNATDLGASDLFLENLRDSYKCSVLGYEYLGYGHSEPASSLTSTSARSFPSEEGCYESIGMAWNYAIKELKILPERIFLMGQSIGSGPTCDLAWKVTKIDRKGRESSCFSSQSSLDDDDDNSDNDDKASRLGGVILISPFRSAAKVITDTSLAWFLDFFRNEVKIGEIVAPILIIHGKWDSIIDYSHGEYLSSICANDSGNRFCAVENADHNDILYFDETSMAIGYFINENS